MARSGGRRARTVPKEDIDCFRRAAVLLPVLPSARVRTEQDLLDANHQISQAWRKRVKELKNFGLKFDHSRLLNCRSAFVPVKQSCRDCRIWRFCPFCWARRASEYWQRADARLFRQTGPIDWLSVGRYRAVRVGDENRQPCPVDLLYRVAVFGPANELIVDPRTGARMDALQHMLYLRSPAMRQAELELWGVKQKGSWLGMLECDAFSFSSQLSSGPQWCMEVRQLWAIPPKFRWRQAQQELSSSQRMESLSRSVTVLRNPTRQTLASYMVHMYTYPSALLYGDPEWAAVLFEALRSQRTAYPYGIFRKEDARKLTRTRKE